MPLPMKTLREAAAEVGISETELRALVDMHKVRAVFKKGQLTIAPDEIGRIKKQRKTMQESALRPGAPAPAVPPKPAVAKAAAPKLPTTKPPATKLPPPPQ